MPGGIDGQRIDRIIRPDAHTEGGVEGACTVATIGVVVHDVHREIGEEE